MAKEPKLLEQVVEATGLPNDLVLKELQRLIGEAGLNEGSVGLEELRQLMVDYLQEVILEAKETFSA